VHGPGSGGATAAASGDWLAAGLPVLFALQGFEIVPLPAGQVHGGARAVPLATVGSLVLAALLYLGLHAACVHALPDLASTPLPLAAAAAALGGAALGDTVALATSVSALGIAIGMIAMTPRYLAALGGAEGLGAGLDRTSPRAVPLRAFAVTWAAVVATVVGGTLHGSLAALFALSSVAVLAQYAVTAASLARLAMRREHGLVPRDAWPAPLAAIACVLLASGAERVELAVVAAMVATGLALRAARRGRA
jgi:amino acid transporter